MLVVGMVFAGIASLLHVYIFVLESLRWTAPRTRAIFATTQAEAQTTKLLAYNQGFYNLFLALTAIVGIALLAAGSTPVGAALILVGTGSMLAASIVLVTSSPGKARSALVQGTAPGLAVVTMVIGLLV
jgi:putative membrane protein